jgi:hypothetical protein
LVHPTYIVGRNAQQVFADLLLLLLVAPFPLLLARHYGEDVSLHPPSPLSSLSLSPL